MTYLTALSADELWLDEGTVEERQFQENELTPVAGNIASLWSRIYMGIYYANSAIEGLEGSDKVTPELKDQLLGESLFFRAFYHFILVNLFGEVPYINSTDYTVNAIASREPVDQVYEKITNDLFEAKTLLGEDYPELPGGRTRANKYVATALLARVYLYKKDWIHAEEQASTVISKSSLYRLKEKLSDVFLKNSDETIWQLIPPGGQKYVNEGNLFNRGYFQNTPDLSDSLLQAFEPGDDRDTAWVLHGTYQGNPWAHPVKYKETASDTATGAEYYTVIRLGELLLIRAEARAHQDKITGTNSAASDLNTVRGRAGLFPTTATNQTQMLAAIAQERRVELFVEWGHRWFDLKRTGKADEVLGLVKSGWQSTDKLYPIPYNELQLNPNMQPNEGY